MLILAHALALMAFLSTAKAPPPRPDFTACAANATDIVVTDPEGVVLESWRGELKPGEVVRLGLGGLTPANTLPLEWVRLRPDRALSRAAVEFYTVPRDIAYRGYYDGESLVPGMGALLMAPAGANLDLRLVLFLRKEGGPGGVWMPAATPPSRPVRYDVGHYFSGPCWAYRDWQEAAGRQFPFPSDASADFTTSAALVEAGRVVAVGHGAPLALGLKEFQADVLACPAPPVVARVVPREHTPITSVDLTPKGWAAPVR